jgi:hypothetical protein
MRLSGRRSRPDAAEAGGSQPGALARTARTLTQTRRKTGRMYVVPVGRHETNGEFLVGAMGAWRENLRGGAAVRLVIDGRTHVGHAELD